MPGSDDGIIARVVVRGDKYPKVVPDKAEHITIAEHTTRKLITFLLAQLETPRPYKARAARRPQRAAAQGVSSEASIGARGRRSSGDRRGGGILRLSKLGPRLRCGLARSALLQV